jgi:hypothetical protein
MWSPVTLNDGSKFGYGLGWFVDEVNGHRHVSHPGGTPGAASIISRYPDDRLTLILLTNGGAPYVQGLDLGIAQRYIPNLVSRNVVKLAPALLDTYAGYYNVYGSQLLKVTREGDHLVADDGGRLVNSFLPISDTEFVAEDADRGLTFVKSKDGVVAGVNLRLIKDRMSGQRLGPLFSSVAPQPDPKPELTRKIETVLEAFAVGGKAVEEVDNLAPQARTDYAHGPSPELHGMTAIRYLTARDVAGLGIERHGARVARIVYCQLHAGQAQRNILVYLTADGLVTDQDTLTE